MDFADGTYRFLTYTEDGQVNYQGRVVQCVEPGIYLIEHFEWMVGNPAGEELVRIEDMLDWKFYDEDYDFQHVTDEAMRRQEARDRMQEVR